MTQRSQCPNCLFINTAGADTCPRCSASLAAPDVVPVRPYASVKVKRSKTAPAPVLAQCPSCLYINDGGLQSCPVCGNSLIPSETVDTEPAPKKRKINEGFRSQCPKCMHVNTYGEALCPVCGETLYDESLKYEFDGDDLDFEIPSLAYESNRARYVGVAVCLALAVLSMLFYGYVEAYYGYEYSLPISMI